MMKQALAADRLAGLELERLDGCPIRPADFRGQKLVVFVCPADEPIASAKQIEDFSARAQAFADCGTWLLGLLVHDPRSDALAGLCRSHHVPVAFDRDGAAAAALGLWTQKGDAAQRRAGIARTTYLLERDGSVCCAWKDAEIDTVLEAACAMP